MESHGGEHSVTGEQRPAPGHSTGKAESQQEATGQEIVTAEPGSAESEEAAEKASLGEAEEGAPVQEELGGTYYKVRVSATRKGVAGGTGARTRASLLQVQAPSCSLGKHPLPW